MRAPPPCPAPTKARQKVSLAVGAGGTRPNKAAPPAPRHGTSQPKPKALPNQTTCWFPSSHARQTARRGMAVARRGRRAGIKVVKSKPGEPGASASPLFLSVCSRHPFPAVASVQRSHGGRGRGQARKQASGRVRRPSSQPSQPTQLRGPQRKPPRGEGLGS